MYVSRTQSHRAPGSLLPVLLSIFAVVGTVAIWAAFMARPLGREGPLSPAVGLVDPARVRSVAYSVPSSDPAERVDYVYVRAPSGDAEPRRIASLPYVLGLHARGSASPLADSLAVLSVSNYPGTFARLTLLGTIDRRSIDVAGEFDYLSELAWSPDGAKVAVAAHAEADDTGHATLSVVEVNARTGEVTPAATFDGVLEAQPVGYSADGTRLYIAVIGPSGSTLWVERSGRQERVGTLSAGRTRDWALSPDGARLAYVDVRPDGGRTYVGRTMLLATGDVTDLPAAADQLGAVWTPGSEVPEFGGPGGSVQLSAASGDAAYVIPVRWSPDGSLLATRVAGVGGARAESIQLATATSRVLLADVPGAAVFGFVLDVD